MKIQTIETLTDLLTTNLQCIYDNEIRLRKIVSQLNDKTETTDLGRILTKYMKRINEKINRLEQIFVILREDPRGWENKVIEEITDNANKIFKHIPHHDVRDAAIIAEIQQISHLLISDYGTACAFARSLALEDVAKLLHETLEDEKSSDKEFSVIAKEKINSRAKGTLVF